MLLVEPFALDGRPRNIAENPMAALMYVASASICTPNSLSQEVGAGSRRPGRRGPAAEGVRGRRVHALPPGGPDADEPHHRSPGLSRSAPPVGSGDRSIRRPGPFLGALLGPPDAGAVPGGLGRAGSDGSDGDWVGGGDSPKVQQHESPCSPTGPEATPADASVSSDRRPQSLAPLSPIHTLKTTLSGES